MTNLQAIQVECKPYEADALDCEKALAGACKRTGSTLTLVGTYNSSEDRTIALAAIKVLCKYLSLTSEKEGEWGNGYSREGLEERIKALCKENELDESEFLEGVVVIRDGSHLL